MSMVSRPVLAALALVLGISARKAPAVEWANCGYILLLLLPLLPPGSACEAAALIFVTLKLERTSVFKHK